MVIQQKSRIEKLVVTSLQLNKVHTISHNHIDIGSTNVNFTLQKVEVRANFPAGTKESVSKTPISIRHPIHISTPKPNVSSKNKCHSTPVTRNVTTHSGHVVKPPK